jgi:hypothetical protein
VTAITQTCTGPPRSASLDMWELLATAWARRRTRLGAHGVRFGALWALWAMVSPSPGLPLEVADSARPAAA